MPVCRAYLPEGEFAQDDVVFDSVEINIYEDETAETAIQPPVSVPCETFSYTIARLDRGSYYVTVDALTDWDGDELAFFTGATTVAVSGDDATADVNLAVGKGDVRVIWRFASGLICGADQAGEVTNIVVTMGDMEMAAACGDGQVIFASVPPGSDYIISGTALSKDGEVLLNATLAEAPLIVLPGGSYETELVF